MALVAITIFPAVLIVMVIYQRYSTPIVRRVRAYLADINDGFNEVINGMSVIQQFRQQARFGERMGKPAARIIWRGCRRYAGRFPVTSAAEPLLGAGAVRTADAVRPDDARNHRGGVLYAFISYLGRLNEPLIELTTQQSMLQQAVVAGERVFELMDRPRQTYGDDERPLESGSIAFDHVSFAYRDDQLVLQDINLEVPSRGFVAWLGIPAAAKARSPVC